MLRYYAAAGALKLFSSTRASRWFYRQVVGNCLGNRRRVSRGMHASYVAHAKSLLECRKKYGAISDGMRLVEIGTGWMHFYAVFLRLFSDVRITLVDSCDNRQLAALKRFFADVESVLDAEFDLTEQERARAHAMLDQIARVETFEELYRMCEFEYVIDPTLATLDTGAYDFIVSIEVLEHVESSAVREQIANMSRILKPGGYQLHHIGIADHLTGYDRNASWKQYITYSERTWRMFFENVVQYVNRLQASEFIGMFVESGMELLEDSRWECDVSRLNVSHRFEGYSEEDLRCGGITLVLRKPE